MERPPPSRQGSREVGVLRRLRWRDVHPKVTPLSMMEGVGEGGMAPFADALATHSAHDAMLINWRYPSLLIRGRSALLRTPLILPL